MQIKKESLIKYGTLFLLVIFFVEFFWVFLYSPAKEEQQASPSPEASEFQGTGLANATVFGYGLKLAIECTPGADLVSRVNNITGVAGVLVIKSNIYLVDITFARAQNETTDDIRRVLENTCVGNFTLLREANLKFSSQVDFISQDGSVSTTISGRDLDNAIGYVDPRLDPGSSVSVFLIADFLSDGSVANLKIQQADLSLSAGTTPVNETEGNSTAPNQAVENATSNNS